MVGFQQLMQCQPQKFTEAGQAYKRMAEGFGKVEAVFKTANQVLSNNTDWVGIAQKQALNRSTTLTKGLQASGQETNSAGTALTTLGNALKTAQATLRAAVAEAATGPLIMTPDGQTIIPPWAYSWPACVEELPRLQALKVAVDVQIKAALVAATAADMAAAGMIAKLAVGQLIKDFGSSHAPTSTNTTNAATTMGSANTIAASYTTPAASPDTTGNISNVVQATTGASTDGSKLNQTVSTADWSGMSAAGTNAVDTRTAQANASGGQVVTGTIGTAAVGTTTVAQAAGQTPAQQTTQAAVAREVTANGRRYVIFGDEVRSGGSVSWRARNPGNIRNGVPYGALPGVRAHGASGTFAVFPDEQTGMVAITRVLQGYGHVTIADAITTYAPPGDGNDPVAYANTVARGIGVDSTAYVDELSADQMSRFAQEVRRVEGWRPGTTYQLDDPHLPAAVRQAIQQMRP